MTTVPELVAVTSPSPDDLLYLVDDPSGTPTDRKVTVDDLVRKLSTPRTQTQNGIDHTLLFAPSADDTQGAVFKRPSATAGDVNTENAWALVNETADPFVDAYLARLDWRGGLGVQSAHFAPGHNGETWPNQAVWVDPVIDVVGAVFSQKAGFTKNYLELNRPDGTTRFQFDANGQAAWRNDGDTASMAAIQAQTSPPFNFRALFRAGVASAVPLIAQVESAQSADGLQVLVAGGNKLFAVTGTGAMEGRTISEPATPSASYGRLFFFDNAGSVELRAKFPNGTVKTVATDV